jgi:hypothetical protein
MLDRRNYLANQTLEIERLVASTRELLAQSLEMLRRGTPDTFLGAERKSHFRTSKPEAKTKRSHRSHRLHRSHFRGDLC